MSSPGLLCLKWNNHTSAFDKLLNSLHLREVYSDGTIVCHGNFYPVHRFVLSTCSEYFEEIFRHSINLNSKHPFIIVKDVQPPQMEALLNYMYRGEVNVPQEMLPELIKAAEAFKIKGLAVPDDEPPPIKSSSSRDRKRSRENLSVPSSQVKKSKRIDDSSKSAVTSSNSDDEMCVSKNFSSSNCQNNTEQLFITGDPQCEVKAEPADLPDYNETEKIPEQSAPPEEDYLSPKEISIKDEKSFESYATAEPFPPYEDQDKLATDDQFDLSQSSSWDNSQGFEGDSNLEEGDSAQGVGECTPWVVSSLTTTSLSEENNSAISFNTQMIDGIRMFMCSACSYQNCRKDDIQKHLRVHTGEKPFHCTHCPFKSSRRENLNKHLVLHSGEKPFQCSQCPYKSSRKDTLQNHALSHAKGKRFQCIHCTYSSLKKICLSKHIIKNHPEMQ